MAIPIISDIIQFFQSIMQILPKSVKYLLALAMVLGFLFVIPFFTHLLGYHCDSQRNVMKTSIFDIGTNYDLSQLGADDLYNTSNYRPIVTFTINKETCTKLIRFNHSSFAGDFYQYCLSDDVNDTNCHWALQINNFKGWFSTEPKCIQCTDQRNIVLQSTSRENDGQYCFSDAYPLNKTDCPKIDLCDIPYGFKFSNDTGNFYCNDYSICGANKTKEIYDVDMLLRSAGAKKVYAPSDSLKYDKAIRIKCDKDLQPQIAVWGIEIFNPIVWVMLYAVAAMFFFLNKIKNH